MTITEVLERVRRDRPGEATDAELRKWLRELETKWRLEVLDTHWPTPAEAEAEPELVSLRLRDRDVYFEPQTEDMSGEFRTVEMDLFDPAAREYAGVLHTTGSAESVLEYVCAPGVRVKSLEVYHDQSDAVVARENGKTKIQWGVENNGEYALITLILYLEGSNGAAGSYSVSIRRYYDGAPATPGAGQEDGEYPDLVADTESSTSLLIPSPDDEVYIYWLYSHIDMRLGELDRYNNDAMMYNAAWLEAAKRFNRGHRPKGRQLRHVLYGRLPVPRGPEDPLNQRGDRFRFRG